MKICRTITTCLLGVMLLASQPRAYAQSVFIDLQLVNPGAQIFNVGDLDFLETGSTTSYFIILLQNTGPQTFRLKLQARILANGVQIALGQSNAFDLPPGAFNLTNQQLATGSAFINDQRVELNFDQANIDFDAVTNLQNDVLATGFLPAGEYRFELTAFEVDAAGNPVAGGNNFKDQVEDNNTLIITNPTTLELLFPGRSVGDAMIVEIATTFPFFQWYSDANPNSATYNISVYEKFPEDESVQDVLNHPAMLEIQGYKESFFQYPTDPNPALSSGTTVGPARPLENGKTYYWFVESVIPTGTNSIVLLSDVFRFKVADFTQAVNQSPQIIAFLRQILGPGNEAILEQLLEQGFEPDGKITLDGSPMEVNELLQLLTQVMQGKIQFKTINVYQNMTFVDKLSR